MPRFVQTTIVVALALLASCGTAPSAVSPTPAAGTTAAATTQPPFALSSTAFSAGQEIPARHSCEGENLSPPLSWAAPPSGTKSFVLTVDDPDAVPVVGFVYDHWLLFNIPPGTLALPEGLPPDGELPDGSRQGRNSASQVGYGGPCPPSGQNHGYVFTLYAVDTTLDLRPGATKRAILDAIEGHILAQSELVGNFTAR